MILSGGDDMATIQLRIFPDGKVQGTVDGIKGKQCTDYVEIIEELTASRTWESHYTEDFYEHSMVRLQEEQSIAESEPVVKASHHER